MRYRPSASRGDIDTPDLVHKYTVTSRVYDMALVWAAGASAGRDATACVREQGGAKIPCVIVEWEGELSVALPVSDLLSFLGLPLPRRS